MGRRGFPPDFRREVLDFVKSGRKVKDVAQDFGISDQAIYSWLRQERAARSLTNDEREELAAAKARIAQLEAELAAYRSRRGAESQEEAMRPKASQAPGWKIIEDGSTGRLRWRFAPGGERQKTRLPWL